jgi:tetratricopeptide (TPR) repeat protein
MALQRGAYPLAAQEYYEASRLSATPELAERATRIALASNNDPLALDAARRWVEVAPDAVPPREVLVRHSLRANDVEAAYAQSLAIVEKHPEGVDEGFREIALLLGGERAHADAAVGIMNRLVAKHGKRARAHYAFGIMAYRLERFPLAQEEGRLAVELEPGWPDGYLLKASALIRLDRMDEAARAVNTILAAQPTNTQIRLGYARLLLEAERPRLAIAQYQAVLTQEPESPEALFALGLLALNERDLEQGYTHFKALFDAGERADDAAWYLAQIEERRKNYREAYRWYGEVIESPQAFDAMVRRAFVLNKLEGLDSARRYLAKLRESNPEDEVRFVQVEADLFYDLGKYQEALGLYAEALKSSPGHPDLLYGRAMVEAELGQFAPAEQNLRSILDRQPEDARSLNALGYLLSNHTNRYEEALSYIGRALKITPEDPAVIDSMGWVQYRLGNLQESLRFLEEAFKRHQDPEIAAHLGEVLWQLGRQDKAKAVWQEALAQDPNHRVLRETVNRLSR